MSSYYRYVGQDDQDPIDAIVSTSKMSSYYRYHPATHLEGARRNVSTSKMSSYYRYESGRTLAISTGYSTTCERSSKPTVSDQFSTTRIGVVPQILPHL